MKQKGIPFGSKKFKKQQQFLCILVCCLVLGNTGYHVCVLTGLFGQDAELFETTPFPSNVFTKILSTVAKFYATLAYMTPLFYIITVSLLMKTILDDFNKFFTNQTCQESCKIPEDIHSIRLLYTKICKAISDLDKDFSYFNGNIFFWNIGLALFILYVILKGPSAVTESFEVVIYAYWLLMTFGFLAALSVVEAMVNSMAHAPLDTIYYINVQDITVEKLAQLNLFLSKLTGTQVGFTTCGLLTITKEFILTKQSMLDQKFKRLQAKNKANFCSFKDGEKVVEDILHQGRPLATPRILNLPEEG
ncbi:hypothetical protein MAR_001371 [Mya arenaria]|uniref:Gustatory receptor n=1 Tax=Mya arenaria TaxID=6604 RepID=A0ABY7FBJ6_MYAAR|nr:hypothetical protein MAR_001371 [Mya arenaria]